MYKLFLCLRYLRRRYIALVAIIGIALCVFMVVIVASVMNGFLGGVEDAARGMMGDVIVDGPGGLPYYEEFIAELNKLDNVEAATPVIYTAGLLRLRSKYTQMVRVVGIRLPQATEVTRFGDGLYPDPLEAAPGFQFPESMATQLLANNRLWEDQIVVMAEQTEQLEQRLLEETEKDAAAQDQGLIKALETDINAARESLAAIRRQYIFRPEAPGLILGVDIPGTTKRDPATGAYLRYTGVGQGDKGQLTLLPLGRSVGAMTTPIKKTFNLIGDQRFGVYLIDSNHVYVDFDVLQNLIEMDGRCDQIQVKIRDAGDDKAILAVGAAAVSDAWTTFAANHPDLDENLAIIQTWRQKQAPYIDPIERQRDLVIIMFGVVSLVSVVLVFAIFYMMVVQKTKDIGILKSIGASNAGVACVFLLYGSAVGLVGSVLGAIGGYYFVRFINPIHDWIADVFDWRVFSREAYMFDKIPNDVDPWVIFSVLVGAMIAGLFGALAPATRAARMEPVEALRYE